jgi:NitT/TauT family transport system substrate-binding protein
VNPRPTRPRTPAVARRLTALLLVLPLLVLAACGSDAGSAGADAAEVDPAAATSGDGARAEELRLGFFANVTHATALAGVSQNYYTEALGDTALKTEVFNAGPSAVEALFAGSLDATYIGPNPAINAFAKSNGEAIRIIAGATSGGASLVVQPEITGAADLRGKTLATPQLGNTQDVALRAWLAEQGYQVDPSGAGDVTVTPTENATTLQLFQDGAIQGAWLPEPWASRLVEEAGAKVLLDEKELWPDGQFVTTHLVVRTEFLEQYPGTVADLLRGHVAATAWVQDKPAEAKTAVNEQIGALSGKPLPQPVIDRAWENLTITEDPVAASLKKSADDAVAAGLTEQVDLTGIYDLRLLNTILTEKSLPTVDDGGLGAEGTS